MVISFGQNQLQGSENRQPSALRDCMATGGGQHAGCLTSSLHVGLNALDEVLQRHDTQVLVAPRADGNGT